MTVSMAPELEALVRRQIDSGLYTDADHVLREALFLLDEKNRADRLASALAVGDDQYARGAVVPWSTTLMDDLIRTSEEMARQGRSPNPDACP